MRSLHRLYFFFETYEESTLEDVQALFIPQRASNLKHFKGQEAQQRILSGCAIAMICLLCWLPTLILGFSLLHTFPLRYLLPNTTRACINSFQ